MATSPVFEPLAQTVLVNCAGSCLSTHDSTHTALLSKGLLSLSQECFLQNPQLPQPGFPSTRIPPILSCKHPHSCFEFSTPCLSDIPFASNSGGNSNQATNTTSTPGSAGTSGGLFGTAAQQPKPAGSLFGNTGTTNTQQSQPSGSNMFSGLSGQQNNTSGGGLFGNTTANTTQQQSGGLFSGASGANNTTAQTGNTGGLFGNTGAASTSQAQSKPFSLGGSTTGGIL